MVHYAEKDKGTNPSPFKSVMYYKIIIFVMLYPPVMNTNVVKVELILVTSVLQNVFLILGLFSN